jgi:hypothetical protein
MVIMDAGKKPIEASTIFNISSNSDNSSRRLDAM